MFYENSVNTISFQVILSPIIEEIRVTPKTSVVVGTTVIIECIADGFPHPEYIWTKTSEKVYLWIVTIKIN